MVYTKEPSSVRVAKRYLEAIYKQYPEYQEQGFDKMVDLFSKDAFYKAHKVAKFYAEKSRLTNGVADTRKGVQRG